MANNNAPTGFTPLRRRDGAAWTANQTPRLIAYDNTTAIFKGDVVGELGTGYIDKIVPGTGIILGVFIGCKYISSSTGYTQFSPYWPGTGSVANGIVQAFVIDDPDVVFGVQATSGPITLASVGASTNFTAGTGNTLTGLSTASLDNVGTPTTTTLPFRIIGLMNGLGNGSDAASAYNRVEVVMNNQAYNQLAGV